MVLYCRFIGHRSLSTGSSRQIRPRGAQRDSGAAVPSSNRNLTMTCESRIRRTSSKS